MLEGKLNLCVCVWVVHAGIVTVRKSKFLMLMILVALGRLVLESYKKDEKKRRMMAAQLSPALSVSVNIVKLISLFYILVFNV